MTLKKPSLKEYEAKIVGEKGKNKFMLEAVKNIANEYIREADYVMSRFLEDFDSFLEERNEKTEKYHHVRRTLEADYSDVKRFVRFVEFYESQHA